MKELSIFIDESGDFGEYDYRCPYYIIAMVMHDQSYDISTDLEKLERELDYIGYPHHCVHAGPIIRQEQEYRFETLEIRQKILKKMEFYLITLLLLFVTGSTLGIICYILYLLLTYLKKENIKWIFVTILVMCILSPYLFNLLDPYTQKRLLLLSNLYKEDWLSIAINSGSGSIMSRIGNPILGLYMGFDHWLLGVGGGYYSHFYNLYLENYFPEALSIDNIEVVGNSAKNLFCRINIFTIRCTIRCQRIC